MNGKQLKRRDALMQKSPKSLQSTNDSKAAIAKGVGLCTVSFILILAASNNSGRWIGSPEPLIDSHPGQFAAYFFAGFAGICGLDLIRKS